MQLRQRCAGASARREVSPVALAERFHGGRDAVLAGDAFVGREDALAALERRADDAVAGRGSLVLITGPAGIGKSRLGTELAARRAAQGHRVVETACWTHDGAPPLWPWHDVIRQLRRCPSAIDRSDGRRLAEAPVPALPAALSGADRFAFFEATADLLRTEAERRPLVVVLDDLHAGDEGTLLATRFVARRLAGSRVLLVGSARPAPAGTPERTAGLLGELEQSGVALALDGLDAHDVARLARAHGRDGDSRSLEVLATLTGGNPLAVRAILRAAPPVRSPMSCRSAYARRRPAGCGRRIPPRSRSWPSPPSSAPGAAWRRWRRRGDRHPTTSAGPALPGWVPTCWSRRSRTSWCSVTISSARRWRRRSPGTAGRPCTPTPPP